MGDGQTRSRQAHIHRGIVSRSELVFARIVADLAEREPDRLVHVFERGPGLSESISAGELALHANQIAARLRADGVRRGDRVAIQMRNHPEFVYSLVALSKLGGVAVPLDPRAVGDQLRFYLERVGCRAAIVADYVMAEPQAADPIGAAGVAAYSVRTPEGVEAGVRAAGHPSLTEVLDGPELPDVGDDVDSERDVWIIQYTSGTTGAPKPIVMRYLTLAHYRQIGPACGYRHDDVPYTGLPLVHGNARGLTMFPALFAQVDHSVFSRWFTASRHWEVCSEHGATTWSNLGGIATAIYAQPPSPADRAHRVRLVVSAGIPPALREPFAERFGVQIQENYGTSEIGVLAVRPPGQGPSGSVGRPLGDREIGILDPEGRPLPPGQTGEIAVRALDDRSQLEYWGDPAASAEKLRHDWLLTGDHGWRDDGGWLFFSHRDEEGGIRKLGDFVPVETIVRVIAEMPEVRDVCVYGIAAASGAPGEKQVVAAVVPQDATSFDPAVVYERCVARLKRSAMPDLLQVVEDLPTTPTQKVQTRVLEQLLTDRPEASYRRPAPR